MPQQAAIVINDGQGTPVAHTFAPNGALAQPDGKVVAEWVDRSSSSGKPGYLYLVESQVPSNKNGVEKVRWTLKRPTLETLNSSAASGVDPFPQKAFDDVLSIEVWVNDRAPPQSGLDLGAFAKNFTATAYFASKCATRERTW